MQFKTVLVGVVLPLVVRQARRLLNIIMKHTFSLILQHSSPAYELYRVNIQYPMLVKLLQICISHVGIIFLSHYHALCTLGYEATIYTFICLAQYFHGFIRSDFILILASL